MEMDEFQEQFVLQVLTVLVVFQKSTIKMHPANYFLECKLLSYFFGQILIDMKHRENLFENYADCTARVEEKKYSLSTFNH